MPQVTIWLSLEGDLLDNHNKLYQQDRPEHGHWNALSELNQDVDPPSQMAAVGDLEGSIPEDGAIYFQDISLSSYIFC